MSFRRTLGALALALLVSACAASSSPAQIFSSGSLSEDVISPNNDGVQDFTVILYTVDVDLANVRILLRGAGGVSLDTLQAFTEQARGTHSFPFDGTTPKRTVEDGSYEVQVVGVGTAGEGNQTLTLPLTIDRVPPTITSWDVVSPGTTLQNGDLLTLQVCYDEVPDSIFVDLSELDSAFDPSFVTTTPFGPDCLRFDYPISAGNTFADADSLPARIRLRDRGGNVSEEVLDLCLSNSPPLLDQVSLDRDVFRNGFPIVVNVSFTSPYVVTPEADFGVLDSEYAPEAVTIEDLGNNSYTLTYRISAGNDTPDGHYMLVVSGSDPGCGYVEQSLEVQLDNAGLEPILIDNVQISRSAFCPAGLPGESVGFPSVEIRFDVIEDSVVVGITAGGASDTSPLQLRDPDASEIITILRFGPEFSTQGTHFQTWNGSGISVNHTPQRLVEQDLVIWIRATSFTDNATLLYPIPLKVDRTPPQLVTFPAEDLSARNGQLLTFPVTFDGKLERASVNLSALDSRYDPANPVYAQPQGNNVYQVSYRVSANNARPDNTNIPIPITATDEAGNQAVTDVVEACLNNLPPQFVSARLLDHQGPFTNGQRISIQTEWSTEAAQGDLVVTADFSALDDEFDPDLVAVVNRGSNVFDIGYTLSTTSTIRTDGEQYPVRVTAADDPSRGCGSTEVDAIWVILDNVGPSQRPTLVASSQAVAQPVVTLSGIAPGAVRVRIDRSGTPVDTLDVDPLDQTYAGPVALVAGINSFTARSLDEAGNLSPSSGEPVDVFLAAGTTFTVPGRFSPGSEFFIASPERSSGVRIRIFNLDGIEIQRLERGSGDLYFMPWDGTDNTGNMTSSGPYIAVAEIEMDGRVMDRIRKAFVFTRRGPEQ